MASWLTYPLQLTGSREFTCDGFTEEQCSYYMQRWHFWYIADYVYALPTVAFFMTTIGFFIIGHVLSSQVLGYRRFRGGPLVWQKLVATIRYLSYRGYQVKVLRWNSAPLGILLLGTAGAVYFFCMDLIPQPYYWSTLDFGGSPPLGTRSGWLALACMPFVFATASKTNWITLTTGVSHERIQVFHRWTAYAFFLLALMHTFPFIVYHIHFHDMVMHFEMSLLFYWTGIVALIFQAWLTFASHSVIRRMGYEFFKATHLLAVIVFIVVFFWHCDYTLTSWHYFIATAAVYVPCFIYPWLRTAFEYGLGQKAHIYIEDNGFIRLTIPSIKMRWTPGQHCFLRFTSFGLQAFSSHPFTICSLPAIEEKEKSELVFYIRHSHGLTQKLYDYAQKHPGSAVPVLVDGPYGGINMQRFNEAERLLVVAGGSGAGWILSFLELFCRQRSAAPHNDTSTEAHGEPAQVERATISPHQYRSLRIVLATRDIASRTWFLSTVNELLARCSTTLESPGVSIEVHLTGEAERGSSVAKLGVESKEAPDPEISTKPSSSSFCSSDNIGFAPKSEIQAAPSKELSGRPDLPSLIGKEGEATAESGSALSVYVCGPGGMLNDVRNAVARENVGIVSGGRGGSVYLHSEHFSWA